MSGYAEQLFYVNTPYSYTNSSTIFWNGQQGSHVVRSTALEWSISGHLFYAIQVQNKEWKLDASTAFEISTIYRHANLCHNTGCKHAHSCIRGATFQ